MEKKKSTFTIRSWVFVNKTKDRNKTLQESVFIGKQSVTGWCYEAQ